MFPQYVTRNVSWACYDNIPGSGTWSMETMTVANMNQRLEDPGMEAELAF